MTELKHLSTPWDVDRHIVLEAERLVLVRFSGFEFGPQDPKDPQHPNYLSCLRMDDVLSQIAPRVCKFCVVYAVDTSSVTEFNGMYELGPDIGDPFAVMFFFRGRHIKVDVGTGNNYKINFVVDDEDLIEVVKEVFVEAKRGRNICLASRKFPHASIQRLA